MVATISIQRSPICELYYTTATKYYNWANGDKKCTAIFRAKF